MNASVDYVFPEKYRILSGSALKMIAVITMLIDHIGAVLLSMYQPAQKILFTLFGREYNVYLIFRDIGRAAFPIFCFLLLEGFRHTRSRFLYGKKSPSFCAALRNSVESDVYKYAALRKTKCVFHAFPRISGLLCHRIFPDQTFDAASLHPGTACCFHFSESRLWMAGVYLPADHVLYAKR